MDVKTILLQLAQQAVQKGATALAGRITQIMNSLPGNGGMNPADVALLASEAQQNGMPMSQEQINALIGAQRASNNEAPIDNARATGPGITSGTGQTVSIAQRAAQAAQAAASGASAQGGTGTSTTPPANAGTPAPAQAGNAGYPGGGPGGYSAAQGNVLGQDNSFLQDFAARAAGLNPDKLTRFSKIAIQALAPLVQARRAAFGLMGGNANEQGLPQDIASFARDFTNGGANFFGNAQNYAQGVMNSDVFKNAVAGLQDQEQVQALYQGLMPLLYAGANPLIQQSAADVFGQTARNFNRQDFASLNGSAPKPGNGVFMDWLNQQGQQLDPITRRIFNIR